MKISATTKLIFTSGQCFQPVGPSCIGIPLDLSMRENGNDSDQKAPSFQTGSLAPDLPDEGDGGSRVPVTNRNC